MRSPWLLLLLVLGQSVEAQDLDLERLAMGTVMVLPMVGTSPEALEMGDTLGSGTVIDNKAGLVVTNYHVVFDDDLDEPSRYATVAISQELEKPPVPCFLFELMEASQKKDIALLRYVKTLPGSPITLADLPVYNLGNPVSYRTVGNLRLNTPLIALGYPGYQESLDHITLTITNGKISGFLADQGVSELTKAWIKTDALVSWGNSGGTVIDAQGRFLGIPTQVMLDQSGGRLGRLRPVDLVLPFYAKAISNPQKPWTGIDDPNTEIRVTSVSFSLRDGKKTTAFAPGATVSVSPGQQVAAEIDYRGIHKGQSARRVLRLYGAKIADIEADWDDADSGATSLLFDLNGVPWPEGPYEFAFSVDGNRVHQAGFTIAPAPGTKATVVDLTGTMVDALTGKPVANAALGILKSGVTLKAYAVKNDPALVAAFTVADRAGRWKVTGTLERGKTYSILAAHGGYQALQVENAIRIGKDDKAPQPIEIKLVRE